MINILMKGDNEGIGIPEVRQAHLAKKRGYAEKIH
jgi:hypothetical protein